MRLGILGVIVFFYQNCLGIFSTGYVNCLSLFIGGINLFAIHYMAKGGITARLANLAVIIFTGIFE